MHGVLEVDGGKGSRRRERSEHPAHQGLRRLGSLVSQCGTQEVPGAIGGKSLHGAASQGQMAAS